MAEKDITEKVLLSYADVFADCINTLVYSGKVYGIIAIVIAWSGKTRKSYDV